MIKVGQIRLTESVKAHKRANTHKGYEEIWRIHLSTLCGDSVLRRVRTCDVQQWLDIVAASARTKVGAVLTKTSLQRAKSFFSGSFAYAISQGFMDGVNRAGSTHIPTFRRDCGIPRRLLPTLLKISSR